MSNRPLPSAINRLRGNPGRRPVNKREPKPPVGVPECPEYISDRAKEAWWKIAPRLNEMGVLTLADGVALEMLVEAYAEYRTALDAVAEHGATYEAATQTGVIIRSRPDVAIASDAFKRVKGLLVEYGLTAASRTKLHTGAAVSDDPLEEFR